MGLFSELIASGGGGEITIEKPNLLPKGIQIVVDYRKSKGFSDIFYPSCDCANVYSKEQVLELKGKYCPNCDHLYWDTFKLIPIYRFKTLQILKCLENHYKVAGFPLEYSEVESYEYLYFTAYDINAQTIMQNYELKNFAISDKIEKAVDLINSNNPVYKEQLIFSHLVRNFGKYANISEFGNWKVDNYLTLREKVLASNPELKY